MKTSPRWLVAMGALCAASSLLAQSSSQQVTVNAVVPVLMNLTVDTNNVSMVFAQSDYQSDGSATKEVVNGTTFKVAANTRWRLYVSSNSQNFTFSASAGGRNPRKECSDLSVSPNRVAGYVPVSTNNREIASGFCGGSNDLGNSVPVSYKLRTTLEGDPPGTYTLTLTYTLMPE